MTDSPITGKLTTQTLTERAATLDLARRIVSAEQNDEERPDVAARVAEMLREQASSALDAGQYEVHDDLRQDALNLTDETFRLAQALIAATEERDDARADRDRMVELRKRDVVRIAEVERERDAYRYDEIGQLAYARRRYVAATRKALTSAEHEAAEAAWETALRTFDGRGETGGAG